MHQIVLDKLDDLDKYILGWLKEEAGNRVTSNNASMLYSNIQQRINVMKLEILKLEAKKEEQQT